MLVFRCSACCLRDSNRFRPIVRSSSACLITIWIGDDVSINGLEIHVGAGMKEWIIFKNIYNRCVCAIIGIRIGHSSRCGVDSQMLTPSLIPCLGVLPLGHVNHAGKLRASCEALGRLIAHFRIVHEFETCPHLLRI